MGKTLNKLKWMMKLLVLFISFCQVAGNVKGSKAHTMRGCFNTSYTSAFHSEAYENVDGFWESR